MSEKEWTAPVVDDIAGPVECRYDAESSTTILTSDRDEIFGKLVLINRYPETFVERNTGSLVSTPSLCPPKSLLLSILTLCSSLP